MEKINTNFESASNQPEATEQNTAANQQRGNMASEIIKIDRAKAKKALRGLVATMLAVGFTSGFIAGGALNEAKHDKAPLSKERYESEVGDFLELRESHDIDFKEDGSVEVVYNDYWKGNPTAYVLEDIDGDAKFESGTARIENNRAGAAFSSENGLSIEESYAQLNSGLAEKLSSTSAE